MNILTVKQVAYRLGTTEQGVLYHLKTGALPGRKLNGRCWIVKASDFKRFKKGRRK
jgi:hypothetical protein